MSEKFETLFKDYKERFDKEAYDDCESILSQLASDSLEPEDAKQYLYYVLQFYALGRDSAKALFLSTYTTYCEEADAERAPAYQAVFFTAVRRTFKVDYRWAEEQKSFPRHAYTILLDFDQIPLLKSAAQLMDVTSPEEAVQIAQGVDDLAALPDEALVSLLKSGAAFPLDAKPLTDETAAALAQRVTALEPDMVLFLHSIVFSQEPIQALLWKRALVLAAMQKTNWAFEGRLELLDLYAQVENVYFSICYRPEVLTPETLPLLPAPDRFAHYFLKAMQVYGEGDFSGYIAQLKAGLQSVPQYDQLVHFLLARLEETMAAGEQPSFPTQEVPENATVPSVRELFHLSDKQILQYKAHLDEINQFLSINHNYSYMWIRAMLRKGAATRTPGSTLIVGSSYACFGIIEKYWFNAINCSYNSQDLYYDYLCLQHILKTGKGFQKCIITMGYYAGMDDLSRSKRSLGNILSNIYYSIFQDAHNCKEPPDWNHWRGLEDTPKAMRSLIEEGSEYILAGLGNFYHKAYFDSRSTVYNDCRNIEFNLPNFPWTELSKFERAIRVTVRGEGHNLSIKRTEVLQENKILLKMIVHLLHEHQIMPILVVPPFTAEYNQRIQPELKESFLAMLDEVPDDFHFVDFNETDGLFGPADFCDADHLSESGAEKFSRILVEMFGK